MKTFRFEMNTFSFFRPLDAAQGLYEMVPDYYTASPSVAGSTEASLVRGVEGHLPSLVLQ